jgi:F-type H+-transporting ATPase subunit delta
VSAQARPQDYAKAIYDLALDAWSRQLADVVQVLKADPELRSAMGAAATPVAEKLVVLDRAVPSGLGDGIRKFLGTLLEAGQLENLDAILIEFERLVRRRPEHRVAHVTSAVPLTAAEQQALRAKLVDRFGADVEMQFDVDASLMGGIHLRVGDQVIDGTVAGKLSALRDRLVA